MTPADSAGTGTPPRRGLLLHLAGPLQAWGHHSHFNQRDTAPFPTRSGIIGLLAAALGRPRGAAIEDLAALSLTVRVDRPGVVLRDLHTVGGGLPRSATVTTAEGKKRGGDATTLLSHRYYLADAAFTAALTCRPDDPEDSRLLQACAAALRRPRWPLFLGRRACPPAGPLLLGASDDALRDLIHLPLAAAPPYGQGTAVDFLADHPLHQLPTPDSAQAASAQDASHSAGRVNDQPLTFHDTQRSYSSRLLYRRTLHLPAAQCAGLGTAYLTALADYTRRHLAATEGASR